MGASPKVATRRKAPVRKRPLRKIVSRSKHMLAVANNPQLVETWTDAELARGYQGKGKAPLAVPMVVYQELARRVLSRVRHRFAAELEIAVEAHIKIITSSDSEDADKLRAINMLYERVLGKAPEHVIISAESDEPWRQMVIRSIVATDPAEGEIVDGEVVEDDDDG